MILAVVDTRWPQRGFTVYDCGVDGEVITTRGEIGEPPVPIGNYTVFRLAATGNHFLSVVRHPSLTEGALKEQETSPIQIVVSL